MRCGRPCVRLWANASLKKTRHKLFIRRAVIGLKVQGFIRVADLQSLTYAAEKAASIAGGETVEQLEVTHLHHVYVQSYWHLHRASE